MQGNSGDGLAAELVDHRDAVAVRLAAVAVRRPLDAPVQPNADPVVTGQQQHGGHRGNGRQHAEDNAPQLDLLDGHEDVHKGRNNGDIEDVAKEHRDPGQPPPGTRGQDHLALMGGEARPRQQRDHLEAGLFLGQTDQPEQHREHLGDDPVQQDQDGEQRGGSVDTHRPGILSAPGAGRFFTASALQGKSRRQIQARQSMAAASARVTPDLGAKASPRWPTTMPSSRAQHRAR